ERDKLARALAHHERGFLVALIGGEPLAALEALPSATDRRALLGRPRVDDLVVVDPAVRTAHAATVVRPSSPSRPRSRTLSRPRSRRARAGYRGTPTTSPGTSGAPWRASISSSTRGRGSWPGKVRSTIDQRESPGRTVTSTTVDEVGRRSGAARGEPP